MNTTNTTFPRALIAEDEPLLAQALQADLAKTWPELVIAAIAPNGEDALQALLGLRPEIAFLDIRMPGLSGLEVAQAMLEDWPDDAALPLLVFVTAYDMHAVEAFELAAVDYLLKPVRRERLALTVSRLQQKLAARSPPASALSDLAAVLGPLLGQLQHPDAGGSAAPEPLRLLNASVGNSVRLIPVTEVIYLQATDKYVNVVCAQAEALLRTSLSALAPRLDERFAQIHRGTIVNLDHVQSAQRDETGKLRLTLRARSERLLVSRLYVDKFRPM